MKLQSNTMAQMVKAVRMIVGLESFGSIPKKPLKNSFDIEIEDDAPKRKPSLEEIDALEVQLFSLPKFWFLVVHFCHYCPHPFLLGSVWNSESAKERK